MGLILPVANLWRLNRLVISMKTRSLNKASIKRNDHHKMKNLHDFTYQSHDSFFQYHGQHCMPNLMCFKNLLIHWVYKFVKSNALKKSTGCAIFIGGRALFYTYSISHERRP